MAALSAEVQSPGRIYFTGGATALLHGWRSSTIDIDLKSDPEPLRFFEAIAYLKNKLDVNVELASPDDFIPALPKWRDRSLFIARHRDVEFYHYDPYGQALAKLQRGHDRDLADVANFIKHALVEKRRLLELFREIESSLIRYPGIDADMYRTRVRRFCESNP